MTDEIPDPTRPAKRQKAQLVEEQVVGDLARELVENIGADAVLVVWTGRRRRSTTVSSASFGNGLAVEGLLRWCAARIEELDATDEEESEEEDD
jgi:hypothetical protein